MSRFNKERIFLNLCEVLKTWNRYEYLTHDGKHVEINWWYQSEGAGYPVEGYFLLDMNESPDPSKIGTPYQDNTVWCGEHLFSGDQSKHLRSLGILKYKD